MIELEIIKSGKSLVQKIQEFSAIRKGKRSSKLFVELFAEVCEKFLYASCVIDSNPQNLDKLVK